MHLSLSLSAGFEWTVTIKTSIRFVTYKMCIRKESLYVTLCAICYHLYNLKNVKKIHEEVLLLVKFQAEAGQI